MTPTWETAARIYCTALQNPKAPASTKASAEADLLRLARMVDNAPKTSTPAVRFVLDVVLWRDNVNGNTYHAAQVTDTTDGTKWSLSFDYGPTSMASSRAIHHLHSLGLIDMDGTGLMTITRRGTRKETTAHGEGVQA